MSLLLLLKGDGSGPGPDPDPTPVATIAVREPEDRLTLSVTSPDGSVARWGGDEVNSTRVPIGLSFSTSMPGGFRDLSCELLRGLNPLADEGMFRDVRCYGPGNRTAWEGRMAQMPRTNTQLQPGAVGWVSHLEDDRSFREIYVDRSFSGWQGSGMARRQLLLSISSDYEDPKVVRDQAAPALVTALHGPWSRTRQCGAWYDSGGIPIGHLYFAWRRESTVNAGDPNWTWAAVFSDDDTSAGGESTGNLRAVGPGSGLLSASTETRRFALVYCAYSAATTTDGTEYPVGWTSLAVYGQHGLTRRGTPTSTEPYGLYATDIMADVVARAAPMLRVTDGSIQSDPYSLTHFVAQDPTTAADLILRLNAYFSWDHAVWDDRTFYFGPPSQETVWVVKTYEGAALGLEGDQAEDLFNGVVVSFTDPIGQRRIVGPPGVYADQTNSALLDTDPLNPVNLAGIPRRYARLDLSVAATIDGAIRIGATFLAETKLAKRRGDISVVGFQQQRGRAGKLPPWMIRSGDWVTVGDQVDSPLRKIVSTSYDHANRRLSMTLDSTGQKLDAILERLQADLVGILGAA